MPPDVFTPARQLLETAIAERAFPGVAVEVGRSNGPIWREALGRLSYEPDATIVSEETIYDLAGVVAPIELSDDVFRWHPLAVPPRGAGIVFYGIWPACVGAAALFIRWRGIRDQGSGISTKSRR